MLYLFRISVNLMDATIMVAKEKKIAEKMLREDCVKDEDVTKVEKLNCKAYEETLGMAKQFPAPYEIVEFGFIQRYKIKK